MCDLRWVGPDGRALLLLLRCTVGHPVTLLLCSCPTKNMMRAVNEGNPSASAYASASQHLTNLGVIKAGA